MVSHPPEGNECKESEISKGNDIFCIVNVLLVCKNLLKLD